MLSRRSCETARKEFELVGEARGDRLSWQRQIRSREQGEWSSLMTLFNKMHPYAKFQNGNNTAVLGREFNEFNNFPSN